MSEDIEIPNYLWQSIVVTILCCVPFGIPAIVFATKVNSLIVVGKISEAQDASAKAKMWCWIAFGLGLASIIAGIVYQVVVIGSVAAATGF
ncbi:MAG: CD225/dispanin family protein [Pontiellaceae bacterium]|nr:CD225/dispanin family protein [Pontiellaceae bacterium]